MFEHNTTLFFFGGLANILTKIYAKQRQRRCQLTGSALYAEHVQLNSSCNSSALHGSRLDSTYRGDTRHQVMFDICAGNLILDECPGFVFRFDLNLGKTALRKHGLQFADGGNS